jgi:hypothetical protein
MGDIGNAGVARAVFPQSLSCGSRPRGLVFIAPTTPVVLMDRFALDHRLSARSEVRNAMSELLLAVLSEALGAALVALLVAGIRRLKGAAT